MKLSYQIFIMIVVAVFSNLTNETQSLDFY